MDEKNPVAIVTASSRGIGAATARLLHSRGYRLGLMSNSDAVHSIAKELDAVSVRGSLTGAKDLEQLVDRTVDRFGRLDAVVINSGNPATGDLFALKDDDWIDGVELLLLSVIRLTCLVTPILERGGGGAIIPISAFGAVRPSLDFPISSVARSGLSAFIKLFTERYGRTGVRMNAVLPGYVDSYPVDPESIKGIPAGRYAGVEEIAETVAFLASSDSAYIMGQNILIDGGLVRAIC